MNITEVRIRLLTKGETRIRAIASITIDGCFTVHDIKILEKEDGFLVSMPSRKNNATGKFTDIAHPINTETREMLDKAVLDAYKAQLNAETKNEEE